MVPEVLHDLFDWVAHGVTMTVLTHEVGVALEVARHFVFMARGVVIEEGGSNQFSAKQDGRSTRSNPKEVP